MYGNVLARTAFLYGLAAHELSREELDALDPFFPVTYAIRAVRRPSSAITLPSTRTDEAAILMYHRIAQPGPEGARMFWLPNISEHISCNFARMATTLFHSWNLDGGSNTRAFHHARSPLRSTTVMSIN